MDRRTNRFSAVSAHSFHDAVLAVNQFGMRPRSLVEYLRLGFQGAVFRLDDTGQVGYGITADGQLIALFNKSLRKGAGRAAVLDALTRGVRFLRCREGGLSFYYSDLFAFNIAERHNWQPDMTKDEWPYHHRQSIVTMIYNGPTSEPGRYIYFDANGKLISAIDRRRERELFAVANR